VQRARPTRRDLAEALDDLLADRPVRQPRTEAAGCLIGRVAPQRADGTVTYTRHVSRILQTHCQECHRPGQIGPMALLDYETASAWSATIREVVTEGRMPPWLADPRHGKFANDRRLPPEDRKALVSWIDQGCPQGDERDLPAPRQFPQTWRIGTPDLVLTMPEPFTVPAAMPRGGIPYQHFVIDPGFREDRWVERAEARPGAPAVVHHMLVFIEPPGRRFQKDDPRFPVLCGTAPGDVALVLQPGQAKRVPAGSRLVLQMHYTPNGTAQPDRSSIGLIFARQPPRHEVRTQPIFNAFFRIPPGDANYRVEAVFTFERPGRIVGFMPHMHLRGKDFLYRAVYPDGRQEVLLSVPRFDFNWQSGYRLAEPLPMPRGSRVHCVAHYDNSAANPNNPDPTRAVYWGDQTWQEMMIGWMDYIYDGE
jgi:mono/diheme cytochrome c family protein